MSARDTARFLTIALAIVAFAGTAAAGQVATPTSGWLVYQRLDAPTTRGVVGRFELSAKDFRFQSLNLLDEWVMDLANVESIHIEDMTGQGLLSNMIVVEGVEAGKKVRRLIAPVDESFRPMPIPVLAGLMHYKLQQFKDAKAAPVTRQQQNDPR